MARAIWAGSLSFGLVNVPVELYSATEDKTIHFNQLQAGTSDRVRNKRVNERTGDEVDYNEIVKGYDLGGGDYVVVTPEELEAVEPGRTRNVEITDFIDIDAIDPVYYQKTYYLAPKGEQAHRAYALLRKAMEESGKVAIATLVMRGKQYLVAIRPEARVLTLETMYFADEVRDPTKEVSGLPVEEHFTSREVGTAKMLIESMASAWDPERYEDTYRRRVEELIERKRRGEEVVTESARAEPTPVVELMAALQASVDAARDRAPKSTPTTGRSTAVQAGTGEELSTLSKAALYDRATELDIPGRSKMSRLELARAVAAAAPGSRRRKAS
ncbi:MAG: non-homologous end joining protein Ku [Acidimicrobiales bacterium]